MRIVLHRVVVGMFNNKYSLYLHDHDLLVYVISVTKITTLLTSLITYR
jgi:hypothetical protein